MIKISAGILLMAIMSAGSLFAQLNGTYTIGGSSPDYASFTAAASDLNTVGVSGPVTFDVRSGTYSENFNLGAITGSSATNTITFQSEAGDADSVILTFAPTGVSDNYTVLFLGTSYAGIRNITLRSTGTSYGRVVLILNGSSNIELSNNTLIGVNTSNTTDAFALITSYTGQDNDNTFSDNYLEAGSYGVYFLGQGGSYESGNSVVDNDFVNQYRSAIHLGYQNSAVIRGNVIRTNSLYGFYYGISLLYCDEETKTSVNDIYLSGGSTGAGINLNTCKGTALLKGSIYNNFILVNSSTGGGKGIQVQSSDYQSVYYNSIKITGSSSSSACLNFTGTNSNIESVDNIYSNFTGGYAVYCTNTDLTQSDHNDLYTTGSVLGYWDGDRNDLSAWQDASFLDNNSISVDPDFFAGTDLHATNTSLQSGTPISGISDDFDGDTRDATTPCMGADEFVYPAIGGTFTVGSGGDYTSLADVTTDLANAGVKDHCIFNLLPGTFNEQIDLPAVRFTSDERTILFQSSDGDSSSTEITYSPAGSSDNFTVRLDGTCHISFSNLTFRSGGSSYARVFHLLNAVREFQINNSVIEGSLTAALNDGKLVQADDGTYFQNLSIHHNDFIQGSIGIDITGDVTEEIVVESNRFRDQTLKGIELLKCESPKIRFNHISSDNNTDFWGVFLYLCTGKITLQKNWITASDAIHGYGIYLLLYDWTGGWPAIISNNYIDLTNSDLSYAIYHRQSDYARYYYNTTLLRGTSPGSWSMYIQAPSDSLHSRNNILANLAGGYSIYSEITSGLDSDHNNLYTSGSNLVFWNGSNVPDLGQWNKSSGLDTNSVSTDPMLTTPGDPHFPDPLLNDTGKPIDEVLTDIDGEMRDGTNPDIGADEFCLPPATTDKYGCTGKAIPDLEATGSKIKWYSDEALTTLVHSGSIFPTGHTLAGTYTYYVTQAVNDSESQASTASLTIYTTPGPPLTSDETICHGEITPKLNATGTNIKWYSDVTLLDSIFAGPSFETGETDAGTYTYYVTQTTNSCESDAETSTLVINQIPSAPGEMNAVVCEGETLPPLTASGSDIRWYDDEGLTNQVHTGGTFNTGHTLPGDYPYFATQTLLACESPAAYDTARIKPLPSPPLVWNEDICYGEATPLMEASGTGITWYSDPGLSTIITDTDSTFTPGQTAVGRYPFYATQTVMGCEGSSSTAYFSIHTLPVATIMADAVICQADTQYFDIGSAPLPGHSYSWVSDIDGFIGTESNPSVKPLVTTTYTLTETIDSTGCQDMDAVTITVNPDPSISVLADQELCESEIHAFNIGETAEGGHTYSWTSDPPGFSSTESNPQITPPGSISYILTKTSGSSGCFSMDSVVFTIHPDPAAEVIADQALCQADIQPVSLGADPVTGNAYDWTSDPAGFTSYESNPTVTPGSTTTYTLTETVVATGCSNTNSVTLTINLNPSVSILGDQEFCESENHAFNIGETAEGGHSYSWVSDPPGYTSSEADPEVTPPGSITYFLTKTSIASGCYIRDSVSFTINPDPMAGVIDDQVICRSDIQAISLGADPEAGHVYYWIADRGGFTSNESNPSVIPDSTTTYTLTETVTATGCDNTNSVTLTIHPNPVVSVLADQVMCASEVHPYQIGETAEAGHSYSWISDPAGYSSGAANPEVTPTGSIIYILSKTTDATGCGIVDSVSFTINPDPLARVLDDETICRSEIRAFSLGTDPVAGNVYEWFSDRGGFSSALSNPSDTPDSTTTYTLTETVTETGCETINSVTITINPNPAFTIAAGENPADRGTGTSLTASDESHTYAWDPGTGLSSTSGYQVTATPAENITYHVTGTNQHNCEADASIDLLVYCLPCGESTVLVDTGDFSYGCSVYNLYKNDLNCSWTLYPDDISKIYLYFYPDDFDVLVGDWVIVYNGTQASEDTLGKFNNDHPPSGNIEGGNSVFIEFITDGSDSGNGFQARWSGAPTTHADIQIGNELMIYPNPVADILYIEWKSGQPEDTWIRIYDNLGKLVLSKKVESCNHPFREEISLRHLKEGIYYVTVYDQKEIQRRKISRKNN